MKLSALTLAAILAIPSAALADITPADAYADFRAQLAAVDQATDTLKAAIAGPDDPAALILAGPEEAPDGAQDRFYMRVSSVRPPATENSLSTRATGCERFGKATIEAMRKVPGLLEAIQWPELPADAAFAINCSGGIGAVQMDPASLGELGAALAKDFGVDPAILRDAKPLLRADPNWAAAEIALPPGRLSEYVTVTDMYVGFVLSPDGSGDVHIVFRGIAYFTPPAS